MSGVSARQKSSRPLPRTVISAMWRYFCTSMITCASLRCGRLVTTRPSFSRAYSFIAPVTRTWRPVTISCMPPPPEKGGPARIGRYISKRSPR